MKSKKGFKYKKKIFSNSLVYRIFMTVDVVFVIFCLILLLLYFIGNYQKFQDSSELLILKILFNSSFFNVFFSFFLMIETIIKLASENKKAQHVVNAIFLLFAIIYAVFCIVFSNVIMYLSLGLDL